MKKLISISLIFSMLFICVFASENDYITPLVGGSSGSSGGGISAPSRPSEPTEESAKTTAAEQFAELLNGSEGTVCSVSQNVVTLKIALSDMPNFIVPTGGKIIFDMNDNSFWAKDKVYESDTPLFYIPEGAEFEIRNGYVYAAYSYGFCGGIAIENHGTLILNGCMISGGMSADIDTTHSPGGGGGGGSPTRPSTPYNAVGEMFAETTNTTNNPGGTAIINYGTLVLENSSAIGGDSESGIGGTAIVNSDALTLKNSSATGGYSKDGTGGTAIENSGIITSGNSNIDGGYSKKSLSNSALINSGTFEAKESYISGSCGTAIENTDTLNLTECNVSGGSSTSDKAVTGIENSGNCHLENSRIEGGRSDFNQGSPGILNSGNIEIENSVIFGGHSETDNMPCGNGIDNHGAVTINSGQIRGCDGNSGGHGIHNYSGASLDIYAPEIPDVFTSVAGGNRTGNAIYNEGTLNVYGGEIIGGYSTEFNGSAAIYSTCQFSINGGNIYGGNGACAVEVERADNNESEFDFIFRGGILQGGYDNEPEVPATSATFLVDYGYTTAERNSEFDQWQILRNSSTTKKYLKCTKTLTLSNIGSDVIDGVAKSVINIDSSADISDKKIYVATYDANNKLIDFGVAKHITEYEHLALLPFDFYGNVFTIKIFVWDISEGMKNESCAEIIKIR